MVGTVVAVVGRFAVGIVAVEMGVVAIVAAADNRFEVVGSWAVVATAAVDIVGIGLVAVASCIPLST